jgi:hypothetical protein
MLMENMSRNKCFLHVRISHVLRFISICDLFTDSPSYLPVRNLRLHEDRPEIPEHLMQSSVQQVRSANYFIFAILQLLNCHTWNCRKLGSVC